MFGNHLLADMTVAEANTSCATFSALAVACTRAARSLSSPFMVESISSALDRRLDSRKWQSNVYQSRFSITVCGLLDLRVMDTGMRAAGGRSSRGEGGRSFDRSTNTILKPALDTDIRPLVPFSGDEMASSSVGPVPLEASCCKRAKMKDVIFNLRTSSTSGSVSSPA